MHLKLAIAAGWLKMSRFAPDMARESLVQVKRAREAAQTCVSSYIRRFAALKVPSTVRRYHSQEKKTVRRVLTVCLFFASSVGAQTMYKCQVDGKVTYSGIPCSGASEVKKIKADAAPTPEDQARAQERAQIDLERSQAQDQHTPSERRDRPIAQGKESRTAADRAKAESAARVANFRAQHGADAILGPTYKGVHPGQAALDQAAAEANAGFGQGAPDPNEKITTHDISGWDRKTRGQIEAEEAAKGQARARARAGDEPAPSGAKGPVDRWESEKVLTHGRSGWDRKTRAEVVQEEGTKEFRREQARQNSARTLTDNQGHSYIGPGGPGTYTRNDGRVCNYDGAMIHCN